MEQGELTIYRRCTPVVDARYGPESSRSPAEVTVDTLAEAAGVDPLELPPLYEFVDLDALDSLFGEHDGTTDADAVLSFRIENWNVFVRADGRIRICDSTQPTDPEPVFESFRS
ncbi:HalOD1 output domain-containing protein [Natrialbaceae archaeon GCM10025810]|uniref:HalOD1 output domain-containing protein n=1 Tax=Halovalidus salilacus TaxID=3075124 RepID=UPI0036142A92